MYIHTHTHRKRKAYVDLNRKRIRTCNSTPYPAYHKAFDPERRPKNISRDVNSTAFQRTNTFKAWFRFG